MVGSHDSSADSLLLAGPVAGQPFGSGLEVTLPAGPAPGQGPFGGVADGDQANSLGGGPVDGVPVAGHGRPPGDVLGT